VTDRFAHLGHQGREESKSAATAPSCTEVEEMAGEGAGELPVRAFEKAHQPRGRDERLDEFLMIEDLVPELPERGGRQIHERRPPKSSSATR